MKTQKGGKCAAVVEKPILNTHRSMIVDGCKVKMNFPSESEKSALNDIKRMMLGGIPARGNEVKT